MAHDKSNIIKINEKYFVQWFLSEHEKWLSTPFHPCSRFLRTKENNFQMSIARRTSLSRAKHISYIHLYEFMVTENVTFLTMCLNIIVLL